MHIGYVQPPAASPIYLKDIYHGAMGLNREAALLDRFKGELASYFSVDYVNLFSSGRAALVTTFRALHSMTPERHKVIIPAFTCWSVAAAVVRAGLTLVPCEVGSHSFDHDYALLPGLLGPDVLCVVAQHLYGVPADLVRLRQLLRGTGIALIEDAAQAMGGVTAGKLLGTMGDIGLFSLGRGKVISTVKGGILITNNPEIGAAIQKASCGLETYSSEKKFEFLLHAAFVFAFLHPHLFWIPAGLPWLRLGETIFDPTFPIYAMCGVQAGLANNWADKLKAFRQTRSAHAHVLLEELARLNVPCPLPWEAAGNGPRLPVFIEDDFIRQALMVQSARHGLGLALTYPDAVDGIPYFHDADWRGSFPQAHQLSRKTLTLPIHPLISASDLQKILILLRKFF